MMVKFYGQGDEFPQVVGFPGVFLFFLTLFQFLGGLDFFLFQLLLDFCQFG